jgi:hypothetical protein
MEDILELYTRPYNPDYPLVCFDESSKQLISEVRKPLPAEPGQAERHRRANINGRGRHLTKTYVAQAFVL